MVNLQLVKSRLSSLRLQPVQLSQRNGGHKGTHTGSGELARLREARTRIKRRFKTTILTPLWCSGINISKGTNIQTGKIIFPCKEDAKSLPSQRYQTALCTNGRRKENPATHTASLLLLNLYPRLRPQLAPAKKPRRLTVTILQRWKRKKRRYFCQSIRVAINKFVVINLGIAVVFRFFYFVGVGINE